MAFLPSKEHRPGNMNSLGSASVMPSVNDEMLQPGNCRDGLNACISQTSRLVELEVLKAVQLVANHPQARVDLTSFEV